MTSKIDASIYPVGENILIRTVTHFQIGKLESVHDQELVLSSASWIADTGRFNEALVQGIEKSSVSEIEPFGKANVIVGRGAIIDCTVYPHKLPRKVK